MTQPKSHSWLQVVHQGFKPRSTPGSFWLQPPTPHEHFKFHCQISMDQKEGFLPEAVTEVAQSIQMDPLAAHSKQDRTPNNDSTV